MSGRWGLDNILEWGPATFSLATSPEVFHRVHTLIWWNASSPHTWG